MGGTIVATNGAALIVNGNSVLDGVTVNGVLDVGKTYASAVLTVTNGLVLNGTALVGNPTNNWYGGIRFLGSQTLSGNGTVVFGTDSYNGYGMNGRKALWLANGGTTLTIGSGITVRGQNGYIGAYTSAPFYSPANVAVINLGTISADVSGGDHHHQCPAVQQYRHGAKSGGKFEHQLLGQHRADTGAGPQCGLVEAHQREDSRGHH